MKESGEQQPLRILANGFIVHEPCEKRTSDSRESGEDEKQDSQIQRHLISGRDFDDILEACRPRNLGEHFGGMPKALVSQMKIFGLIGKESGNVNFTNENPAWGSPNFDSSLHDSESEDMISKSSHSTVISHFTNTYSYMLSHSQSPNSHNLASPYMPAFQIQMSKSLEMPSFLLDENNLRTLTRDYDKNVFVTDSPVIRQSTR